MPFRRKKYAMIKYRRFQFGWVIVIIFLIVMVWMTFAYIYQWGNNPVDTGGYIFFIALFSAILSGFYGMTVTVTEKQIKIKLGIGFYTKTIELSSIRSVDIRKCPVCYGYGIRIIPNGLLYSVSGRHAVEIKFRNKNRVTQIGTNDWENLKNVISGNIPKKPNQP